MGNWEETYMRFRNGETMQAIAMAQPKGKAPVQVSTVLSHVLTALSHGMPVDLQRAFTDAEISIPEEADWMKIEEAAAERNCNVDAPEYKSKEVLCGILGPENVNREPTEKSEADKAREALWYTRLRIWEALKKVRFQPSFSDAEENVLKKQKLA